MPTGKQIRAARVLLDWTAETLATEVGLSRESIESIELGKKQARESTMDKIVRVFGDSGIEFLDNQGVRFQPEGLEILEGEKGIKSFLDSAYDYAQRSGGVLRQNGIEDETFFAKADAVTKRHCDRMLILKEAQPDLVVRVLMAQGIEDFQCPDYAEYRWFPPHTPSAIPFYVFGNTVGLFALGENATTKIYQIASPAIAMTYTKQFDSAWDLAIIPPTPKQTSRKKS